MSAPLVQDSQDLDLDRASEPPDSGLALNLPGNAVRALAMVGVRADGHGIGEPVRRREYRNVKDKVVFAIDADAFWGDVATSRCVLRRDLFDLLLRGLPADSVRWDAALVSTQPVGDEVEAVLADGSIERCALLVGADGVHSTVRSASSRRSSQWKTPSCWPSYSPHITTGPDRVAVRTPPPATHRSRPAHDRQAFACCRAAWLDPRRDTALPRTAHL